MKLKTWRIIESNPTVSTVIFQPQSCVFILSLSSLFMSKISRPSITPGTWNIPEHPGTLNSYDNYEKKMCKLKFWACSRDHFSEDVGHVTCSFSQAEQLYFERNCTEELSTVGNQLKKYMRSLIIDDILSEGGNVSTEYYPGSFRAVGSKYKVSGVTSFKHMKDLLSNGSGKSPSPCCS